jgi:hypothetical protein
LIIINYYRKIVYTIEIDWLVDDVQIINILYGNSWRSVDDNNNDVKMA